MTEPSSPTRSEPRCICYCHGDFDQIADLCDHCRAAPPPPAPLDDAEYQRIRVATGQVLRALSNCPYCGFDEGHHDDECVLHELAEATAGPYLARLNPATPESER